jgi:hypothetical protein
VRCNPAVVAVGGKPMINRGLLRILDPAQTPRSLKAGLAIDAGLASGEQLLPRLRSLRPASRERMRF